MDRPTKLPSPISSNHQPTSKNVKSSTSAQSSPLRTTRITPRENKVPGSRNGKCNQTARTKSCTK
ncbi:hypothetical protein PtA15_5A868 [Puccinia triticina]|uniref:Uncharacterized protein n=1 Tax=Puccinia triticina TaxID=208348 RepID=A0ABY7CK60_9BASI|nr:uncharacterized protein PtA15_5A868 [Puccinia triticina]WAQ85293.1 hypothetical protein PtA15_5A868 [Puccinia triticina]